MRDFVSTPADRIRRCMGTRSPVSVLTANDEHIKPKETAVFTRKSLASCLAGSVLATTSFTASASTNPFAGTNPIYAYVWHASQAQQAADAEMAGVTNLTVFLMNSPNYAGLLANDSDPYMIALDGFNSIDQIAQAAIATIGAGSNELLDTLEALNAPHVAVSAVLNAREQAIVAVIIGAANHKAAIHQAFPCALCPADRGPRTPLTGPETWISNVTVLDPGAEPPAGLADDL